MFLTSRIGIDVGVVGLLVAVNAFLGMLGAMIGGKLIDTIGRKPILLIFRTISGVGYVLCAFTRDPLIITAVLMFAGFFGGFSQPVYTTIITDLTEGEQRKGAFSLNYLAINIGFSVGPLLAGFLYENYLEWLFLGDALTIFISVILVMVFVPETKPSKEVITKSGSNESEEEGGLLAALWSRPELVVFSLIIVIFFIAFAQTKMGLPLQVESVFSEGGAKIFGSLMAVNAILCTLLTVFITSAVRNLKASLTIAIGGLFYAVGFGMLFVANSFFGFVISTAIWTVGEILIAVNTGVYIADHTPITHRGRFNSVFPMIRRLGFFGGPIIAGYVIKFTDIRNLWLLIGALSFLGALMMYKLYRLDREKNKEKVAQTA